LLLLLAPLAPYITEELWAHLGNQASIHTASWPAYDPAALVADLMTIIVQINGRVRDRIELPSNTPEEEVRRRALATEKIRHVLADKEVRKIVYVPGRLVNIVI